VTTEDLIVRLAGLAGPVQPLAPPMRRLWRWTAGAVAATVTGAAVIGVRADSATMSRDIGFLVLAGLTMATGVVSAAAALVLSVPGAERSAAQRWAPIAAGCAWAALLTWSVLSGGSAVSRLAAFPFHIGCVIQIIALSLVPAWALFAMLRRAAPLRLRWSAGLASLAALALAAAGTQFICPVNDPAHLLVGHVVPVAGLAFAGALIGSRALARPLLKPRDTSRLMR
jgi:hypothetical protein